LLLAQPELLAPPLATLSVPRVTLPPTNHPLPLSLLRRARERAGPGRGRVRLCGAQDHHLQESGEASERVDNSKNQLS
jgi:hypothetical protein